MTKHVLSTRDYTKIMMAACANSDRYVQIGNSRSGVRLRLVQQAPPARSLRLFTAVRGRAGGEPAALYLPQRLFEKAIHSLSEDVAGVRFDAASSVLLFEAALADLIDAFEETFGVGLEIGSAEAGPESGEDCNLAFKIEEDGRPLVFAYAQVNDLLARRITRRWCAGDRDESSFDPAVTLDMRIGSTTVSAGELSILKQGDILLFDSSPLPTRRALLVVEDCCAALVDVDASAATISQPLRSFDDPSIAMLIPRASSNGSRTVHAVLARSKVPLSQVEALTLNQKFELPHGVEGPVELICDTGAIGQGRLVRCAGGLGVHLARRLTNG